MIISKCLSDSNFCINRISSDALDEAGVAFDSSKVHLPLRSGTERERLHVSLEKVSDLDSRGTGRRGLLRLDRGDYRVFGTDLDSFLDVLAIIRLDYQSVNSEKQIAVGSLLPIYHILSNFLTSILRGSWSVAYITCHRQNPSAENIVRDFKIPILLVMSHSEHARCDFQLRSRLLSFLFIF